VCAGDARRVMHVQRQPSAAATPLAQLFTPTLLVFGAR
jgi:hypothetical protein